MTAQSAPPPLDVAWASLNEILDPCSVATGVKAGLVDLGLIRTLLFEPLKAGGYRAVTQVTVTHPFCTMAAVFLKEVRSHLLALDGVEDVEATLDEKTMWTPEMMSPEYRKRLEETTTGPVGVIAPGA